MGSSYSGEDEVVVYLNIEISKLSNSNLGVFADKDKENLIEVCLGQDKIEKFYFHDLNIDLKDKVGKDVFDFFNDYVKKENIDYSLSGLPIITEVDFEVYYAVSGYYDEGRTYGPPEYCYPPEHDEERVVEAAGLRLSDEIYIEIPKENIEKIYDAYKKEIEKKEFSPPEPDYPDYDYDDRY